MTLLDKVFKRHMRRTTADPYDHWMQHFRRFLTENREAVYGDLGETIVNLVEGNIDNFPLSLQNDDWIRSKCLPADGALEIHDPMISPFHDRLVSSVLKDPKIPLKPGVYPSTVEKKLSFGVTGFGYDVTLAPKYKIFSAENALAKGVSIIDPKRFDPAIYLECEAVDGVITMPAKSFILAKIHEYIRMPPNVLAILLNKSTYARCGVTVTTTVMEPGWHGEIVVEITNDAPLPVRLYANEGIGQLIFLTGRQPSEHYGSRNEGAGGKYQGQTGITEPRI